MSSSTTVIPPVNQVQLTITRKSDGELLLLTVDEKSIVSELKAELKSRLPPQHEQGCRLIYKGKVLKSKRTLKHYGLTKNHQPPTGIGNTNIVMDDSKNWKSDSSSSSSEVSD
ncbi:unnamed protein product [Didymodactylos carnosus]|uniref:Ubiquitin-like domain-containing protein n=2 Tax=Didymodactylos carnosus TaxID=1234261 RepID=A0A814HBH9_9BILA|nr:unnamed protein product [Didymodactylos carnosus]CAF3779093.1 unnamed protein product [Didymodactylos carnosus]